MLNPQLNNCNLSKEEYNIYARHLIIDKIGINGQKRLKKAKILFIGAGGLACPAILYLAAAGIGCLGIIDYDKVSTSNLHRQILYNKNDLNKLKTISAKNKIKQINPICQINIYSYKLGKQNAFNLIRNYDIILDASDNFTTRYIIDSTCHKLHKTHIYGAVENFEGQISIFNYKSGPKYSDLYPENLNLQDNTCNNIGILGVLTGIIGVLQATEAIKIITGLGKVLSGYILIYNALDMSFKKIKIKLPKYKTRINNKNENQLNNKNQISVFDLKNKIQKNNNIGLIDVRQTGEYNIEHINHAINMPLKELSYKNNINLITHIANNKILIIYCSNNSRSIIASQILNKYQINHYRLQGGFNEWCK